jgi:hypothetical protein
MPIIPASSRQRQEGSQFTVSLGYIQDTASMTSKNYGMSAGGNENIDNVLVLRLFIFNSGAILSLRK